MVERKKNNKGGKKQDRQRKGAKTPCMGFANKTMPRHKVTIKNAVHGDSETKKPPRWLKPRGLERVQSETGKGHPENHITTCGKW